MGQSAGLVNGRSRFGGIVEASVYVDGKPLYLETAEPLPPEAWPS